jgi:hypothetical protein
MPNPLRPGQTPPAKKENPSEKSPHPEAASDVTDPEALCRQIASLQAKQKEAIVRLSTQRSSVEEVGVILAELEKELKQAKEKLSRVVSGQR